MRSRRVPPGHTQVRSFQPGDLEPLVAFWNVAFADQRNFSPLTAAAFRRRVLECPAFDPAGLLLAWHTDADGQTHLVGLIHAFRPMPDLPVYQEWAKHHSIALLYVLPYYRHRGIGSDLLRAAENWLYYCPVQVPGQAQPCYGTEEGLHPPFFGSTQRMGIGVRETGLIQFLARRGYAVIEPGDVSMRLASLAVDAPPPAPDLSAWGLRLQGFDEQAPFVGREPPGREQVTLWGDNQGDPYAGLGLVDDTGLLQGHISWYPMAHTGRVALAGYWLAPPLRGKGLGAYLLDLALYEMAHAAPPRGGYGSVEVLTHLVKHPLAVQLYEHRDFVVDEAWVHLEKT